MLQPARVAARYMAPALSSHQYLKKYPNTPPHMVDHPGARNVVLDSGFVGAEESLGWPQYEGGYLHWRIFDVRKYPRGWEDMHDTPYRVYLSDNDDWNVEAMFATLEEAQRVVQSLKSQPVSLNLVRALKLKTT